MASSHAGLSKKSPPPSPVRSPSSAFSFPLSSSSAQKLRRESWTGSESPYSFDGSRLSSINSKFSLGPDPRLWGFDLSLDLVEPDDDLHNPHFDNGKTVDGYDLSFSRRGAANLGCLSLLIVGFLLLFIGYPVISYARSNKHLELPFNLGGANGTGKVPSIGKFGLVDHETPEEAHFRYSRKDGTKWQLVFSDEFNTDGRSFYPGDDPYWEAADMHYWATNNLEWYDPAAVTTDNGSLVITFSEKQTHGMNYEGGLISTWNKFCFTGGMIETSVQLPGLHNVVGMWPAIWTLGNLGRVGYGASLEGMWPYSYDSCDVGTAPNQTRNGEPIAATTGGDPSYGSALSVLPGQRLSRCTCLDDSTHPGPKHEDGTFVGRAAPEIDVIEAQVTAKRGEVSQSAQFAPFNRGWVWQNTTDNEIIPNPEISRQNPFIGSATQQATSVVTNTNQLCYEFDAGCYSIYGFEYKPGYDDAYISWVSDNQTSWTLNAPGLGPDLSVEISARPIPQEPMYLIVNLGMSKNFGEIDFRHLTFPNHLRVDYIRVYQDPRSINVGCNPRDFPTEAYINRYIEAYTNSNLTTWRGDYGQTFPKNSFLEKC